jgi:L-cysteine/cystine lyase
MATEHARDVAAGRSGRSAQFERGLELRAGLRSRLAELLSVDAEQLALTASTTDGCNIVLAGLGLRPEDEIVTTEDEHFGLIGPLHASGARVIVAAPDPDAIVGAVTPRTRLLAFSEVLWTTGRVLPVRELREHTGIPMLVDGAQAAGAIPVDARGIDFYAISAQKWIAGPDATGALVVADPDRLRIARPGYFSQLSHHPDGSFEPRGGAKRFETNWMPAPAVAGLTVALDQRPDWCYARSHMQAERLRALLAPHVELVTPAQRATLVSFRPPRDLTAAEVVERLDARDVVVRELPGRNLVRASVGWWTSDDDLERLCAVITE